MNFLNLILGGFLLISPTVRWRNQNLMKINDLRQFPSPTGSRGLNAPHGGLWRSLRPSTDTCQERPLRRRHRKIFQTVTGLFKPQCIYQNLGEIISKVFLFLKNWCTFFSFVASASAVPKNKLNYQIPNTKFLFCWCHNAKREEAK